ncbi:LysM peptidoglycan-binding domain-containing protein [Rheinheimera sp. UJ51]|uniref:LysM peptidoglycan-binding domain-containing protein n=1 Tax=Rheinheimera sp. UJ51 TaxID=2892446 RepID=UPI001E605914|nr:LysM domain-containing protein [Rheinheimera sp. UJ51]MCC5453305.1 LysM peptidoglycan-binding domain-containing protein [Rheinheimera sp. UJ51]
MLKKITLIIAASICWFSASVLADVLKLRDNAPMTYVVKAGDTLWDISGLYLNEPWLWPQLWQMNPQVDNPHLIYPGDILTLTFDSEGRPVLAVNKRAVRLTPQTRTTHKNPDAIATLPLGIIRPFLTYDQALSQAEIDALPYILGSNRASKSAAETQTLYVNNELLQGAAYAVYRQGRAYVDPDTGETLGHETRLIATTRVIRSGSAATESSAFEPAAMQVLNITREIRQGDKVIPAYESQSLPVHFLMTQPSTPIEGRIIAASSDLREMAKMDVVILNRGEQELKAGHMLGIYRQSPTVVDGRNGPVYLEDATKLQKLMRDVGGEAIEMPKEKVGEMMVFKTAEKVSFAIVTQTIAPVRVGDSIGNL